MTGAASRTERLRRLGMDRPITRRDFIDGIGVTAIAAASSSALAAADPDGVLSAPQDRPGYYPPALTGMRGSHPGSFEIGHALRDGTRWDNAETVTDTGEHYDLVIAGGGISGLSAAYFFRKLHGPQSKILVLDNHDDFGGHAKRNEFSAGGRTVIGCGGTLAIE